MWLELGDGANVASGERVLHIGATATLTLVRGLIAIALALYSDRTVREILSSDAQAFFRELGRFARTLAVFAQATHLAIARGGLVPQERLP